MLTPPLRHKRLAGNNQMNRRLITSPPFFCLIVSGFLFNTAHAQDLELNPKNGYTHEQATALFSKFDLATWNLDGGDFGKAGYHGQTLYISPSKNLVVASFATGEIYDTFKFARAIRKSRQ